MTLTSIAIRQLTARAWQLPFKNSNDIFFFYIACHFNFTLQWLDDTAPLLEESDGSGACAKIVFLVLLSSLGMAIGVIFFEMGGMQTLNSLMNVESIIDAPPVKYDPATTPMDVNDDFYKIYPSPINPGTIFKFIDKFEF